MKKLTLLLFFYCLLTSLASAQPCRMAAGGGLPAPVAQAIADAEAEGLGGSVLGITLWYYSYQEGARGEWFPGVPDIQDAVDLSQQTSPYIISGGYMYPNIQSTSDRFVWRGDYRISCMQLFVSFSDVFYDSIHYALIGTTYYGCCKTTLTREQFSKYTSGGASLTGFRINYKYGADMSNAPSWAPECLPDEPEPCATAPTITVQQPPKPE